MENEGVESESDSAEITCLEYSACGDYIAVGTLGGQIKILKIKEGHDHQKLFEDSNESSSYSWSLYTQFQSHEVELDYLKSLEIEGRINQIKFCFPNQSSSQLVLSCNEKTVKLWSVAESRRRQYQPCAAQHYKITGKLVLPIPIHDTEPEPNIVTKPKQIYANAHAYHINSLGLNSDHETFISVDDLRINWWNLNHSDTCFNIIDIKPESMEQLTQVITSAQFHPTDSNILMYSSSRGAIKLYDTRASALCTTNSAHQLYCEPVGKPKTDQRNNGQFSFVDDILNSYSDVNYSADGRYLIARNYLSVKVWDVKMNSKPVKTFLLHEYLRPMIYKLYNTENIFDKFDVCCSPNGKSIATGSYNNQFKLFHLDDDNMADECTDEVQTITLAQPSSPRGDSRKSSDSISPTTTVSGASKEDDERESQDKDGQGVSSSPSPTAKAIEATSVYVYSNNLISEIYNPIRHTKVPPKSNRSGKNRRMTESSVRLDEKVLHCAWHPKKDVVAVAGESELSFYEL